MAEKLSWNLEVPEPRRNTFGNPILRWILAGACGRGESRPAPPQFVELCNKSATPRDLAEIISPRAVYFVTSEVTYLSPLAGKKIVRIPIGKSLAGTRPKPIDCAQHLGIDWHASSRPQKPKQDHAREHDDFLLT